MTSSTGAAQEPSSRSAARKLFDVCGADYHPLQDVPDEFKSADGTPRDRWKMLFDQLTEADIADAREVSERHISAFGLFYRREPESKERLWPISELPLIIDENDWSVISKGVIQRATVLESMLADIYGPAELVASGVLPAALVAGNADFVRPLAGVAPAGGRWMHIYAADLGRGPDGRWWVLRDRAQAPAGLGYVLENRLALSKAYPTSFAQMNVQRLAPFFRAFRNGLSTAATRESPRICLLSPGLYSPTYSEHSYLARYLGFLLVEGDDLIVHDGALHVKTIAGLKRADVLWRQVTADYLDPLELNEASRLGVPRLISIIREGHVVVANHPGSGFVESRALMSFMHGIAEKLQGQALALPSIATWWCGQESTRSYVLNNLDRVMISNAFERSLPGFDQREFIMPSELSQVERERLVQQLTMRGIDYVAQEVARLSTMPVMHAGKLEPRPFILRVYVAATADGWQVLPGGLCLISDKADARMVNMTVSNRSADVWVLSDKAVGDESLLPKKESVSVIRKLGNLPSRAADNLFWYGRYVERAEAVLRLVRSLCSKNLEPDLARNDPSGPRAGLIRLLMSWGSIPETSVNRDIWTIATIAIGSSEFEGTALSSLRRGKSIASAIRERLSIDNWKLLGTLETQLDLKEVRFFNISEALNVTENALATLAAIAGLAQENTNRVAGWRFLDIGRRLERAVNTCQLIEQFAGDSATSESLDVLLDLIDSQISYRSRYLIGPVTVPMHDMALLDPYNPRSVGFQIAQIMDHLSSLPTLSDDGIPEAPMQILSIIHGELLGMPAEDVTGRMVQDLEQRLIAFGDSIAARYFLQRPEEIKPKTTSGLA